MNYEAVLNHHSKPVPRYTSYPTAPLFQAGVGGQIFQEGIQKLDASKSVSVYIHIPFCDRLCWFCGCHTKHTLKYASIANYIQVLLKEIELLAQKLPFRPKLGQLHLGGGSPSLLRSDELVLLKMALAKAFEFTPSTEISIEIDPSDVDASMVAGFVEFGTTRASIGVQDFHPDVQAAINRPQGYEVTRDVICMLREAGVGSVNIDALYGLPLQHESRLLETIEKCITLQPDRMALFGYAHVPWMKKHQRLIKTQDLPGTLERFEHSQLASKALVSAGYDSIGIDHFAKPTDSLAQAARDGTLKRNFQGYTVDSHETMFGLGGSSIGRFKDGYVQNTVATNQYEAEIADGILPKGKGLKLTEQDHLRGHIIERLMCDFAIDFDALKVFSPVLVEPCLDLAKNFIAQDEFDLCTMDGSKLIIKDEAKPFTRIIAAQFDAYYQPEQFQFSKAV